MKCSLLNKKRGERGFASKVVNHSGQLYYYKARYYCFIHYFVTTHAAVVGNFIVCCKSTTSVTRIFL